MLPSFFKEFLRQRGFPQKYREKIQTASISLAVKEQGLTKLSRKLGEIVPDIRNQYTSSTLDTPYLITKVRAQHSFQIFMVIKAFQFLQRKYPNQKNYTIVDVGDSYGTHIEYINGLFPRSNFRSLSVNLDQEAVNRIKAKGLEAICTPAENLEAYSIDADIFLSFETLEHLMNPFQFLSSISKNTDCKLFVLTVPYVASSRVGLSHIRQATRRNVNPENTHIFELSPSDWKLIFLHSGWRPIYDKTYFQYPKKHPLGLVMKGLWKRMDFEGFYGVLLTRDRTWSKLYSGW